MFQSNQHLLHQFKAESQEVKEYEAAIQAMLSSDTLQLRERHDSRGQLVNEGSSTFDHRYPSGRKKHFRRCTDQISKDFPCPYEGCSKAYGAEGSLNLHIKLKHGGGNKTQRIKLARELLQKKPFEEFEEEDLVLDNLSLIHI